MSRTLKRKPSKWNLFVKKIFQQGQKKNKSFSFKDALKEASSRKHEMNSKKGGEPDDDETEDDDDDDTRSIISNDSDTSKNTITAVRAS